MSRYVRDDKQFREQVIALADAGLVLGDPTCSIHRARPCNECAQPTTFEESVRVVTEPQQTPKGKLPEFLAGVVAVGIGIVGVLVLLKVLGWLFAILWSFVL